MTDQDYDVALVQYYRKLIDQHRGTAYETGFRRLAERAAQACRDFPSLMEGTPTSPDELEKHTKYLERTAEKIEEDLRR